MRLIADLALSDPALGLAIEEVLLNSARASGVETVRLWRNSRAVILGRSQSLNREVDEAAAARHGIPIRRRISGGGTVYHYPGNLNVSVFSRKRTELADVSSIFAFFGRCLSDVLSRFSCDVHALDNGLYIGEEKIGGAAQAHRGNVMLYHTTVLVQPSIIPMASLLAAMRPGYATDGIASRPRATTTLSEHAGRLVESHELVAPIVDGLACALGATILSGTLSLQERQQATELQAAKYGRMEWNARM